jgi:hypothetical protein
MRARVMYFLEQVPALAPGKPALKNVEPLNTCIVTGCGRDFVRVYTDSSFYGEYKFCLS